MNEREQEPTPTAPEERLCRDSVGRNVSMSYYICISFNQLEALFINWWMNVEHEKFLRSAPSLILAKQVGRFELRFTFKPVLSCF